MICGDFNYRLGKLDGLYGFSYPPNQDTKIDQHGCKLFDMYKCKKFVPLTCYPKTRATLVGVTFWKILLEIAK